MHASLNEWPKEAFKGMEHIIAIIDNQYYSVGGFALALTRAKHNLETPLLSPAERILVFPSLQLALYLVIFHSRYLSRHSLNYRVVKAQDRTKVEEWHGRQWRFAMREAAYKYWNSELPCEMGGAA